jgi:hypothetical protein
VKDLAAAGITVSPAQDPMGRALVTAEEIAPKIVARKDSLQAKLSAAK